MDMGLWSPVIWDNIRSQRLGEKLEIYSSFTKYAPLSCECLAKVHSRLSSGSVINAAPS